MKLITLAAACVGVPSSIVLPSGTPSTTLSRATPAPFSCHHTDPILQAIALPSGNTGSGASQLPHDDRPTTWEVEAFPSGAFTIMHGTIDEVHAQLLRINPRWDDDFRHHAVPAPRPVLASTSNVPPRLLPPRTRTRRQMAIRPTRARPTSRR